MTSAVKLESIFCGSKISPQVKMYEATAKLASSRSKRLLPKPKARKKVTTVDSSNMLSALGHDDNSEEDSNDSEDDGSLDEEEEETTPPKTKKKVHETCREKESRKEEELIILIILYSNEYNIYNLIFIRFLQTFIKLDCFRMSFNPIQIETSNAQTLYPFYTTQCDVRLTIFKHR